MADTREEAMKQAVAMSDAKANKEEKKTKVKDAMPDNLKGIIHFVKDKVMDLWAKRYGKATMIGGGLAFVFFIILSSMSSCQGQPPPRLRENGGGNQIVAGDESHQLTDAIVCVYEDSSKTSKAAYEGFVEIANTSDTPITASDVVFSIDTTDKVHVLTDNNIVLVPNIIYPGEKGYMFSRFNTELVGVKDKKAKYTLSPQYVINKVNAEPSNYEITDDELISFGGKTYVDFTVQGVNGVLPSNVDAYVVIYNSKGRCMGYGEANLMNLNESEGDAEIEITNIIRGWGAETPADYEIYLRDASAERED